MIKVQQIDIEHFRGIRKLVLDPEGKNLAVFGNNGAGKSGVIDAIEFCLTGSVSRLTGAGTGNLSVRAQGPHIDCRTEPAKAKVKLVLFNPARKATFTLTRNIATAQEFTVEPDDAENRQLALELATRPEIALSRRDIIKYIFVEPAKRAEKVEALLRLDGLQEIRKTLTKCKNSTAKSQRQAKQTLDDEIRLLKSTLSLATITPETMLGAVNERRELLSLPPLTEFTRDTVVGLEISTAKTPTLQSPLTKTQAQNYLSQFVEAHKKAHNQETQQSISTTQTTVAAILADPNTFAETKKIQFLQSGLPLVTGLDCPFCNTPWDIEALKVHVRGKIEKANAIQQKISALKRTAETLSTTLGALLPPLRELARCFPAVTQPTISKMLTDWIAYLQKRKDDIVDTKDLADWTVQLGSSLISGVSQEEITQLTGAVDGLPELSKTDKARTELIRADERLISYRKAAAALEEAKKRAKTAERVSDLYEEANKAVLDSLYDAVQEDFCRYYRSLNDHDEKSFTAELEREASSLDLKVDFYGRGLYSPIAYHSEGHQDSMGLCLYLALVKQTFGDHFTFSLLDDVLTSIDVGHRREFCRLLKNEFPGTQFLLTTHDRWWKEQMIADSLVTRKRVVCFRGWTVENGPFVYGEREAWEEIQKYIAEENINSAAQSLRYYLEQTMFLIAEGLKPKVTFNAQGEFECGELLIANVTSLLKLCGKAKQASHSWGLADKRALASELEKRIDEAAKNSKCEQWAVNRNVHFNPWANATKSEFESVANSFKTLVDAFRCPTCGSFLEVDVTYPAPNELRCPCTTTVLPLKDKPKEN